MIYENRIHAILNYRRFRSRRTEISERKRIYAECLWKIVCILSILLKHAKRCWRWWPEQKINKHYVLLWCCWCLPLSVSVYLCMMKWFSHSNGFMCGHFSFFLSILVRQFKEFPCWCWRLTMKTNFPKNREQKVFYIYTENCICYWFIVRMPFDAIVFAVRLLCAYMKTI